MGTITKVYVGKLFSLKNVHRIPWQSQNSKPPGWHPNPAPGVPIKDYGNYSQGYMQREEYGGHVLILEERAKRVQVMTLKGKAVWISKYYLHTEINESLDDNPVGELGKIITELAAVATSVDDDSKKKIHAIMHTVRMVQKHLE